MWSTATAMMVTTFGSSHEDPAGSVSVPKSGMSAPGGSRAAVGAIRFDGQPQPDHSERNQVDVNRRRMLGRHDDGSDVIEHGGA